MHLKRVRAHHKTAKCETVIVSPHRNGKSHSCSDISIQDKSISQLSVEMCLFNTESHTRMNINTIK